MKIVGRGATGYMHTLLQAGYAPLPVLLDRQIWNLSTGYRQYNILQELKERAGQFLKYSPHQ